MQDETSPPKITVEDIDTAPTTAVTVQPGPQTGAAEDYQAAFVRLSGEHAALQQELESTKRRVRTIEILDELIEPYARKAFIFMCSYCGVVAAMLVLHGFTDIRFKLPDSVLDFLVGSTAVTVIGLVGMVLTGIFVGARSRNDAP